MRNTAIKCLFARHLIKVLHLFVLLLLPQLSQGLEIALTFDDAPMPSSSVMTGDEKTRKILRHLQDNKVSDAIFFVTTRNIDDAGRARLTRYTEEGYHLAHHSHNHLSAKKTAVNTYLEDFYRAHLILKEFDNVLNLHRFPYLHYSADRNTRARLDEGIKELGYQNGYVTVDNFDWYINAKLQEALETSRAVDQHRLGQLYVEVIWQSILFYDGIAKQALGRSPKHVLLLHENDTAALFLGDLIRKIRSEGWKIIAPEEAYKDAIANEYSYDFDYNGQGRVAAIAEHKGVDKSKLRHPNENTDTLDLMFNEYGVFK